MVGIFSISLQARIRPASSYPLYKSTKGTREIRRQKWRPGNNVAQRNLWSLVAEMHIRYNSYKSEISHTKPYPHRHNVFTNTKPQKATHQEHLGVSWAEKGHPFLWGRCLFCDVEESWLEKTTAYKHSKTRLKLKFASGSDGEKSVIMGETFCTACPNGWPLDCQLPQ